MLFYKKEKKRGPTMSEKLLSDIKLQYERTFDTIRKIVEIFPENRWLRPHGDEYYIPSRIAYHIAEFIDGQIGGGFKDPEFFEKLPFGPWFKATVEELPDKNALTTYLDESIARAQKALADADSDVLMLPVEQERAWMAERMGATRLGAHVYIIRELSAHTGEMNKMLVENGLEDVWC